MGISSACLYEDENDDKAHINAIAFKITEHQLPVNDSDAQYPKKKPRGVSV
jgi:hypothetical protein